MRTAIVYEVMFGSAQHVVRVLDEALTGAGADVLVTGVRTTSPDDLSGCEMLLIGAPTHVVSRRPDIPAARRAARSTPTPAPLDGAQWTALLDRAFPSRRMRPPAVVFDTRVDADPLSPDSPARRAARALRAQGFEVLSDPISFRVHQVGDPLSPPEVDRVRRWAALLAGLVTEPSRSSTGGPTSPN